MTDQERAALLAWLDERITECEVELDKVIELSDGASYLRYATMEAKATAFGETKAHIESEAAHDES